MKVSTKGRYGLRALLDLAAHEGQGTTALANIAERQGISQGYLEQIFSTLRKAGVVTGIKGPQGGYALAQPAEKTYVRAVVDVLEGDLFTITDDPAQTQEAEDAQLAIRQAVWGRVTGAAAAALDGLTLSDLVEAYRQYQMKDNYIYHI